MVYEQGLEALGKVIIIIIIIIIIIGQQRNNGDLFLRSGLAYNLDPRTTA